MSKAKPLDARTLRVMARRLRQRSRASSRQPMSNSSLDGQREWWNGFSTGLGMGADQLLGEAQFVERKTKATKGRKSDV